METVWFTIISLMLATYAVLEGFDFGVGVLHLFVAKTDEERKTTLAAIGPFWDGNEVWLLAGGGVLFFAFPRAYAAGFSGFYLPLTVVLWLLILRGLSIEFRSLEESLLWRSFWDGAFFLSSTLMAIVLGASLGNIIRGVPLTAVGYFSGSFFTNFQIGPYPGVLDWYTVLAGLFTLAILAMQGALFLRLKTSGEVQRRSTNAAKKLYFAVVGLGIFASIATAFVQPVLLAAVVARPLVWVCTAGIVASAITIPITLKRGGEVAPFLASCGLIVSMLAATAAGLYPVLLSSTLDKANNLDINNASAGAYSLQIGIYWWVPAIILAIGYFVYLFRTFKGKTQLGEGH